VTELAIRRVASGTNFGFAMTHLDDPYKILGIAKNASASEIKAAYRAAAMKYHPDTGGETWAFQKVQQAYEQLSKPANPASSASTTDPNRSPRSPDASPQGPAQQANQQASEPSRHRPPRQRDKTSPQRRSSQHASSGQQYSNRQYSNRQYSAPQYSRRKYSRRQRTGGTSFFVKQLPLQNETTTYIFVSVLDIFMTYMLLRFGGIETNPIADYFFARWDIQGMIAFKMVMVAIVTVLAQIVGQKHLARGRFILRLGTIVVTGVVVYSTYLFATQIL
jgi:hypothetical protein